LRPATKEIGNDTQQLTNGGKRIGSSATILCGDRPGGSAWGCWGACSALSGGIK
jgi:hypothetical protein